MRLRIKDVTDAVGGKLLGASWSEFVTGVSIDSRTIKEGELFIAIRGKNFDGHDFIEKALAGGAAAVISDSNHRMPSRSVPVILVGDTTKALGFLAHYHRMKFNIPVIGITGSNGKTTVKELIASILSAKFKCLRNKGTENNFIGVPLTLLRLDEGHGAAVLELGANHAGEIDYLSRILSPTIGVITNIGPSHLEYFKTLRGVLKAKREILKHITGTLVVNGDDPLLKNIHFEKEYVKFSIKNQADLADVKLHLSGMHNISNALAAVSVARLMKIDPGTMKRGLAAFKGLPGRMQSFSIKGINIIDDSYNSNPLSSMSALEFLSNLKTKGKKIFITGDMLELGGAARHFHKRLGSSAAASRIDRLITVGPLSKETMKAAEKKGMRKEAILNFESANDAADAVRRIAKSGDAVLVKGSRAMHMEKIIKELKKK